MKNKIYRWLFKKSFSNLSEIEQISILNALYHRYKNEDKDVPEGLKEQNTLIKNTCGYLAKELIKT